MFLHAGASLHGHEYSAPPQPQNRGAIRIPYLRSALRQMSDAEANAGHPLPSSSSHHYDPSRSDSSTTVTAESYDTPTRPPRPLSYAAAAPVTPAQQEVRHARPRPKSDYFPRKEHAVRFAEPASNAEDEPPRRNTTTTAPTTTTTPLVQSPASEKTLASTLQSEDDSAYSELSDANTTSSVAGRRRRRRTPRSGARYLVAQPPPRVVRRQRRFINLRPSLMLQLQQLTDTRPRPAFDILPSSVLRGPLIGGPRLARRFPRLLGGFRAELDRLDSDDLIVATSEDYDDEGSDDSSDELGKRELLAVVSPAGATTDIVLADGTIWTARRLASGSYEFTQAVPDGTAVTARWVRRKVAMEDDDNYKFTFSVLDPGSRRHPIMATLTASTLEVLDNYTTVSPSCSGRHPPTRPFSYDVSTGVAPVSVAAQKGLAERTTLPVDEGTKMFITVSAMWISLQLLGMVPEMKVSAVVPQAAALPNPTTTSTSTYPHSILKTPCCPATPAPSLYNAPSIYNAPAGEPRAPTPGLSRDGQPQPLNSGGDLRRALSSGAAFMTRRKSVTKKRSEGIDTGAESAGEQQSHMKRRLYTRIKKALGLNRDDMDK